MVKKLTITVSDEVYAGLHKRIGARKISKFIDQLVRPHVDDKALMDMYREAAADPLREAQAREWDDVGIADGLDDEAWPDAPR